MQAAKRVLWFVGALIPMASPGDGLFDDWLAMASSSQDEQPRWITPLATVTPRLEQEFRFDYLRQRTPAGADVDNYGNGKGLELIPSENTELILNGPNYAEHSGAPKENGFGDVSASTKYRFAAANESNGNYIVTGILGVSVPIGGPPNGGQAVVITPTIAGGKGCGRFDLQSTLGMSLPADRVQKVGRAIAWNTALQYHLGSYFWPEVEMNYSHYLGGPNDDRTQVLVTSGVVFGKFVIHHRVGVVCGLGYQAVATHFKTEENALVATLRMPF